VLQSPTLLRAEEYRGEKRSGETRPLVIAARTEDDTAVEVILKVRHPESGIHFEGTSLACELICAVLARAVGLPVADYSIVEVTKEMASAVPDARIRKLLENNIGMNFGTRLLEGFDDWHYLNDPRNPVLQAVFADVMTFDAIVLNTDRRTAKPNLLWQGDRVVMIDHALALPVYTWSPDPFTPVSLLTDAQVRDHCVFRQLYDKRAPFTGITDQWKITVSPEDLTALRGMIPSSWEQANGHLDTIFAFLKARADAFATIPVELRRVVR